MARQRKNPKIGGNLDEGASIDEKELIQDLAERFGTPGAQAASLPPDYILNVSDPDVLLSQRADGTTAATFSARGTTARSIPEAAEQDVDLSPNDGLP
jgi:hypothetical protein